MIGCESTDLSMLDDEKESIVDKILADMQRFEVSQGEECKGCGYAKKGADLFRCEYCGGPICDYCYNMTLDSKFICRKCLSEKKLTIYDVLFEEDGAGRPFF
jgi:hypothetical protein